jgi:spore maturation protein CgeB
MNQGPRLQLTDRMRRILDYRKFAGPVRMLVLETGYFFDQSWVRAAQSLGWRTAAVPSAMTGGLTREQIAALFNAIGEFKPDFILTSNYAGMDTRGIFARFFEDARIPYVSWFTDTPRMILYGREMHLSHYAVAATWERAYTPHFEAIGFQHVHFMPLATDPALFDAEPVDTFDRDLAFVGASMTGETAEAVEKHAHLPHVLEAAMRAFDEGRVTRENYAAGMTAILGDELLAPLNPSERRNVELLINYEATRRQREALARTLAPLGLEVRGDPHWRALTERAGGNLGYFDALAPFYRSTAVNVNSTSLQMRWAVNQRVFDCPAAGGFLITDNQRDMETFFEPDTEAVVYGSLDELRDKASFYLRNPAGRADIVRAARRRILAAHTHAHRLLGLEQFMKERYA